MDYGTDIRMIFDNGRADIDPSLELVTGPLVVAQSLFVACTAIRGTILSAPDIGCGLGYAPNRAINIALEKQRILDTARADSRVNDATVTITASNDGTSFAFDLAVRLVGGERVYVSDSGVNA
jgi:hypothetical protein